jgi:hypothetical protein
MSLTVATLTQFTNADGLSRCKTSIANALPSGGKHVIIPCYNTFERDRYESLFIDEYVAVVDDDDTIDPHSLRLCVEALQENPTVGLAFTNEVIVSPTGEQTYGNTNRRTWLEVAIHPRTIHHLAVFRSSMVCHEAKQLSDRFGFGIDWFLRATTALTHGAIHVNYPGYFWHQHHAMMTHQFRNRYAAHHRDMGMALTNMYAPSNGIIPTHNHK